MVRTALQLYSLREVERPLPELVSRVGAAGYDGVEFAYRLADADREAVREAMDRAGVAAAGAHVPIDRFEPLDRTVDAYGALGCETLVVPYLDESEFASRAAVERAAARLTDLAERCVGRGVAFGYHNHDHEFVPLDDGPSETAYDALAAATPTSVDLQVDVGLAALAGRDPVELLDRYADRIRQVHLKDYDLDAGESVDLGTGDVDVAGCVEAALDGGVDWLIVEFEDSPDPLASAERSAEALASLL